MTGGTGYECRTVGTRRGHPVKVVICSIVNLALRAVYRSWIQAIRVYQWLLLDLHVWGRENIPKGPKIYVSNHITATDVCWILPVLPEFVHVVHGPAFKSRWMSRVMRAFEQISARPGHLKSMISDAVEYLRRGEPVGITPEGDLHDSFSLGAFQAGVAAIYRRVQVPIVPMALVAPRRAMQRLPFTVKVDGRVYRTITVLRGPYCINIGEPGMPELPEGTKEEQNRYITQYVKERIAGLIEDVRVNKFWM
jgi:1-acyl-sn-glycerol-3-phosphate acyltransferase